MSKKYVISSTTFSSLERTLDQIKEWKEEGSLDENLRVYEINKKTLVYKVKVGEIELLQVKSIKYATPTAFRKNIQNHPKNRSKKV